MSVPTVVIALVLALWAVGPAAAADKPATPLLEAVAYVHPNFEPVGISFVDWARLKRLHDGEHITSSSPLQERQRLMLDIARSETLSVDLGIDRLATWPGAWGWDDTDLEWKARFTDGRVVLRFGEHWDAEPFRAALESSGHEVSQRGGIELWRPRDDAEVPAGLALLGTGQPYRDRPDTTRPDAPVAIATDARTVVIHRHGDRIPARQLAAASRPHLQRIIDSPLARAATALDRPVTADVAASRRYDICGALSEEGRDTGDADVVALVDPLHHYDARAGGYSRQTADATAQGRIVFSYPRPWQARADLAGRSALVEADPIWGPPGAVRTLIDAHVDGAELIIDVEPVHSIAGANLVGPRLGWEAFAMCGPST